MRNRTVVIIVFICSLYPLYLLFSLYRSMSDTYSRPEFYQEYIDLFCDSCKSELTDSSTSYCINRNPISFCSFNDYDLMITRMDLANDIPLGMIIFEKQEIKASAGVIYSSKGGAEYDLNWLMKETAPATELFLGHDGTFMRPLIRNDSMAFYFTSFHSIGIETNPSKLTEFFFKSDSGPILNYERYASMLFIKRNKKLYFFFLTSFRHKLRDQELLLKLTGRNF